MPLIRSLICPSTFQPAPGSGVGFSKPRVLEFLALLGWLLSAVFSGPAEAVPSKAHAEMPEKHRAYFEAYCVSCHGEEKQKGKVRLDNLSMKIDSIETADRWQKVLGAINSGEMPPEDHDRQPGKAEKAEFLEALSQTMVVARKSLTDQGGRITMRRLNRREYQNTLREILGVEVSVSSLPADGGPETFDTIGSSLFMSPDQLQLYRQIGRKALDLSFDEALRDVPVRKMHAEAEAETLPGIERSMAEFVSIRKRHRQWVVRVDEAARRPENAAVVAELRQKTKDTPEKFYLEWIKIQGAPSPTEFGFPDAIDANMMNSRWDNYVPQAVDYLILPKAKTGTYLGVAQLSHRWVSVHIPRDWPAGEYKIRARVAAVENSPVQRRYLDFLSGHPNSQVISTHQISGTMKEPQIVEVTVTLDSEGRRSFMFGEKGILGNPDGKGVANQVFRKGYEANHIGPDYALWVDWVEAEGPLKKPQSARTLADLKSQLARLEQQPEQVRPTLEFFARRSLRGREAPAEFLDRLEKLYAIKRAEGEKPLEALKEPVSVLFASPSFLYLAEPAVEGQPRKLTGPELASRLSFFLWSAPPDEVLLQKASCGELTQPGALRREVDRLLADPRAGEFTEAFVRQWLGLARLDFFQFDERQYPDFDLPTKAAAKSEVFETFKHLLHSRGSLERMLKSDTAVLNALLAQYYGIPGIEGDHFREVKLPADSPRGGLLGMAAILAMGGNGEQTSPVERGAWVLRKLLHDPPPPAPANVPQLNRLAGKPLTTRERIQLHQEDPQCTQCHRKIDPIGFGLENFDAAGRWRTEDARPGVPNARKEIHPAGAFYKGAAFKDYFELRSIIASQPGRFARGFTEALIEYGLGRPFGFSDEDLASAIVQHAAKEQFSLPEFLYALVESAAFQLK